jgi:hypothetical protein
MKTTRHILRTLAVLVALGSLVLWLGTGAHRGWTQTSVQKRTVDEVTGLEAVTYEKRFVMGVELLTAAWVGAGVLAGVSLFFRNKPSSTALKS